MRRELIKGMFEARSHELARCWAPPGNCDQPAIRAHSVQNASVLDLLAENGHVIAPEMRIDASTGPKVNLGRVGRNKATTFLGLCGEHDRALFDAIENGPIDPSNAEHAFLLAYRAAVYELHATASVAGQMQKMYQTRVGLGLDPGDRESPSGLFAVERAFVAWKTWRYKAQLDEAFVRKQFGLVESEVCALEVSAPTVAASGLFSIADHANGQDLVCVCLSILPLSETRTVAILSYLRSDRHVVRPYLAPIRSARGQDQWYEISKELLRRCQNFVLAPRYVNQWSSTKRATVEDYFRRTVLDPDFEFDSPELVLFI